jgi:cell shape-determining protein MreC
MSKISVIVQDIKDNIRTLKDTFESEKIKLLNHRIESLSVLIENLEKENKQLRKLVVDTINKVYRDNQRTKDMLGNLRDVCND